MQRRDFLKLSVLAPLGSAIRLLAGRAATQTATRKILIAGGNYGTPFIRYMADAHRQDAAEAALPADRVGRQPERHHRLVQELRAARRRSRSRRTASSPARVRREAGRKCCSRVDGIVASGGNTLNQQAIWKAQGIDVILRQAWDRGIVLGGASAGSLCWFEEGTTDSRPKELTTVKCLGFLKGSHCPHYDREPDRRPLYQQADRRRAR